MEGVEFFLKSDKAVKSANEFRAAMTRAADAVDKAGTSVDGIDKKFDRIGTSAAKASKPVDGVGRAAKTSSEGFKAGSRGAEDYGEAVDRAGKRAATSGVSIKRLIAILGGAAVIRASVRTFADYEDQLAVLGAVAGKSGDGLGKLEQAARDVSRQTKLFTTSEAISGLTELSRAGLDSSAAMQALRPTADLATVGLIDLGKSAGIVTKTLAQFNLSASESGRVADVLAKGANSTNTDVSGLAFSLSKAGVAAGQFGVDLETTVAALGQLANKGVQADRAGTGLARIMIRLANPTDRAREALTELGLSIDDVDPKSNGLIGVLTKLSGANLSLVQSTKLVDAEFADLLVQLSNGVPQIEGLTAALNAAGGESATQAAARFDTLGGAFQNLKGAAEEFTVAAGNGGLAGGLKSITNLSAETLRVLSGDTKAFLEASEGAKVAATSVKVFGVALGALALASATKAVIALNLALVASPIGLAAAAVGGIATALLLFSSSTNEVTARLKVQREELGAIQEKYQTLEDAVSALKRASSGDLLRFDASSLQSTQNEIAKIKKTVEELRGADFVDASALARLADLFPDDSKIGAAADAVRRFRDESLKLDQASANIAQITASTFVDLDALKQAGAESDRLRESVKAIAEELRTLDVVATNTQGIKVQAATLRELANDALKLLDDLATKSNASLKDVSDKGQIEGVRSAVQELLKDEQRRLDLQLLQGDARERAILIARAEEELGRGLNQIEREAIAQKVDSLSAQREIVKALADQRTEAEAAAKIQRDLPSNLADLQQRYADQLRLAQAEGDERTVITAEIRAANDAKAIGLALDSDAFESLKQQAIAAAQLRDASKDQKRERKDTSRQDELFRGMTQEEQLLRVVGLERENLRVQLEAENEARQAGLVLGSQEALGYVKRRVEAEKLARVQEELADLGAAAGSTIGSGLARATFDGEKLRDVIRGIGEDLASLAFQKSVTDNLSKLLSIAGQALGNYFAGSSADAGYYVRSPGASSNVASSASFTQPIGTGTVLAPNLRGGIIPAMTGQLISSPSVISRGGRNYSAAEGGGSTPEAIVPLERDAQGRLGVISSGGGGASTIVMSFPSVRSSQDARAMRSTLGQQVRRMNDSDKRGRRGLRPKGL